MDLNDLLAVSVLQIPNLDIVIVPAYQALIVGAVFWLIINKTVIAYLIEMDLIGILSCKV